MVIRTNVMALNSHRHLGNVSTQQRNASGRLSSGFRINSAADDAAGLAISEKMRAQIRGLNQAARNAQDGISLIQTAEGAMQTINEMVVRIRELVIQAANDTNVHEDDRPALSDRAQIQREIDQLLDEIDAVSLRTEFNTRVLLDGRWSAAGVNVSITDIAAFVDATASGDSTDFSADQLATLQTFLQSTPFANVVRAIQDSEVAAATVVDQLIDITGATPSDNALITGVPTALASLMSPDGTNPGFADAAALETFLREAAVLASSAIPARSLTAVDILTTFPAASAAVGTGATPISEADVNTLLNWLNNDADFSTDLVVGDVPAAWSATTIINTNTVAGDPTNGHFQLPAGFVTWFNANRAAMGTVLDGTPVVGLELETGGNPLWFQIGANEGQGIHLNIESITTERMGIDGFRSGGAQQVTVEPGETIGNNPDEFMTMLDEALAHVTGQRAILGAVQNRLEFTIQNLQTASENLSAAESRVRDADMALEMMRLTQANVLQQAATAMLAQANQAPQAILQLLG
jgi:flagellin